MVNPHWDEKITEDIGFKGPHFNESIQETWSPQGEFGQETWSPQGEFGQHGEFEGWRSQEDPPSYRSDWQDHADEFTGIQSNVPSGGGLLKKIYEMFGGSLGRLGGGFDTPYGGHGGLHKPGPWNEFDPPSPQPYPSFEQDWGEDLMAVLSNKQRNWMEGAGNPNFYSNFPAYFDTVTGKGDCKQKLG